jgi:hypothetical protein
VARIFVCPSTDADTVRAQARRAVAAYLNVPVYAEFHRWIGRAALLAMAATILLGLLRAGWIRF